jgi:hypothetical protein
LYFFVFGIRVGVHLREDCHHLVDASDNIAISVANKIMHYNKVDTQVILKCNHMAPAIMPNHHTQFMLINLHHIDISYIIKLL